MEEHVETMLTSAYGRVLGALPQQTEPASAGDLSAVLVSTLVILAAVAAAVGLVVGRRIGLRATAVSGEGPVVANDAGKSPVGGAALQDEAVRSLGMHARVLDSMREGVSVADESGMIMYTNPAEDEMFGYGRGELLGQHVMVQNAYPAEENARIVAEVIRELAARGVWTGEWMNRKKDGTPFVTHARITTLEADGRRYWVCVQEDVTERRRVELEHRFLEEASILLSASFVDEATLVRLARHCVPFLADYASVDLLAEDGEIRRVETAHVDPDAELLVRRLWSRYPYAASDGVGVPEVIRSGRPVLVPEFSEEQVVAFARDAEHLALLRELGPKSFLCVPLSARGRVYGALSLVYSETRCGGSGRRYTEVQLALAGELARRAGTAVDNARLYREAEEARAAAERANAVKSQFLATMSHELRTPLNAIAGYTELLEMGVRGPVSGEQRDDLARIRRSQQHLLRLITDILSYAQLDAGRTSFAITDVPIAGALGEMAEIIAPQVQAKGLRYVQGACDAAAIARADPEKVQQILLNLVSNAVKFTARGGTITVSCAVDDATVQVIVRDTGAGIAPDQLEAIFEPFVQGNRQLNRPREGVGLGLAISRELARAMNGEIRVVSEVDAGAEFVLTLTRAPAQRRAESAVGAAGSVAPGARPRAEQGS